MPKKEKKGVGSPFTDTTNLVPQGSFPAREITPAATTPSLFAGVLPEEISTKGPQSLHRHPLSSALDATDAQLAQLGLIVPADASPKNHEYMIDTDEEDGTRSSSSSSGSATALRKIRRSTSPERMHSAQNHKFRKIFKLGKVDDRETTPLNTVAENEIATPIEKSTISDKSVITATDSANTISDKSLVITTNSTKTTSDKGKDRQRLPYPANLHTSVPAKFVTAEPRLSPMEYARMYYLAKKQFDDDGVECPLPRPEAYWAWTENHDRFLCVPKVPNTINRACLVTKLDEPFGPRYVHTEIPALRPKQPKENKLRKAISNADLGLARLRELAAESKNKLLGRKAQTEEHKGRAPVLPMIDVGGTRLSVSMFGIVRD